LLQLNTSLAQNPQVIPTKEKGFSKKLIDEYFSGMSKDSLLTKEVKWKYYFSSEDKELLRKFSLDSGIINFTKDSIESDGNIVYHIGLSETRKHSAESLYKTILKLNKIASKYGIKPTEAFGAKDKNAKPCYPEKQKVPQNP